MHHNLSCRESSSSSSDDFELPTNSTRGNASGTAAAGTAAVEAPPTSRDVAYMTVCSPPAAVAAAAGGDGGTASSGGRYAAAAVSTTGRKGMATWNRMAVVKAYAKTKGEKRRGGEVVSVEASHRSANHEQKNVTDSNNTTTGCCLCTAARLRFVNSWLFARVVLLQTGTISVQQPRLRKGVTLIVCVIGCV